MDSRFPRIAAASGVSGGLRWRGRFRLRIGGLLALGLLSACPFALAQTAILQGRVTDQTGAAVAGAKVTAAGASGKSYSGTSRIDGTYSIPGLPAGQYSIRAAAPDLALRTPIDLTIQPGTQTLDLQLSIVVASQQVAVQDAAGPALAVDPASNASATVLRGADLDSLADDSTDLAADLQALAGPAAGPNGGQVFVDGFSGGEIPSKDSIREVRLNQNPFSPEYDKLGLGRIEIFTKPGSDKLRGTAFFNFGTDFWNSRNPYAAEKAPFLLREYGGNVGGPMSHTASFFLDVRRDATDNGSIINGVTLDPVTLAYGPYTNVYRVEQRAIRVSPRVDLQLNPANTLTVSYRFTDMDIPGAGIGSFNLVSRGYDAATRNHTLQIAETALLNQTTVNELRFQYFRSGLQNAPFTSGPAIQVLGAFSGGGATIGRSSDAQNSYEGQDYVSLARGKHTWRLGARVRGLTEVSISPTNFAGTYTFSGSPGITSIQQYQTTLQYQQLGYSPAQVRSLGGGATQFSIATGNPRIAGGQTDLGAFAGDDWRLRPNLTLSYGLRYEMQSNIQDWRDFAPRVAVAWAPGAAAQNTNAKTVLRAGFGIFYDRFALANTLLAERYNGITQKQYFIANPDTFPAVPDIRALPAALPSNIEEVSSQLRAPYTMQTTLAVERQLPLKTKLAVTYANSHGLHLLRSRDINAPLPGTFDPNVPSSQAPIFLIESAGLYNQNQLIVNVTSVATKTISINGSYVLNRALSNTDGVSTFPANQYDLTSEYGPAATDIRQRFSLNGSITTKWNFSLSPFVVLQSSAPFNITVGQDLYGTTLFNARPGFATDPNKPGVVPTPYGLLDPNPTLDERLVPRNYGRGPGSILVNLRVGKTVKFGPEKSLVVSMAIRNIINHNNPGPIIGALTSPLFGQANQPAGAGDLGGGGFSESANNRRLELQVRFTF